MVVSSLPVAFYLTYPAGHHTFKEWRHAGLDVLALHVRHVGASRAGTSQHDVAASRPIAYGWWSSLKSGEWSIDGSLAVGICFAILLVISCAWRPLLRERRPAASLMSSESSSSDRLLVSPKDNAQERNTVPYRRDQGPQPRHHTVRYLTAWSCELVRAANGAAQELFPLSLRHASIPAVLFARDTRSPKVHNGLCRRLF